MKRILLIGILLFTLSLSAQDLDEKRRLDEVVVSATRTDRTVLYAPGHASLITAEEIKASGAADLADLLNREAGVFVRDYGGAGANKSVSIRGASSSQVLVLVDGIRQNDSRAGGVNLANYSLENVERIEIIRGGYGALYGSDAVGGVINIITKKEADDSFSFSIQNYSYIPRAAKVVKEGPAIEQKDADWRALTDTQEIGATLAKSVGDANIVLSGNFIQARNEFVWKDDEYVDDYRKRVNADTVSGGADLALTAPLADGTVRFAGGFYQGEVGVPGEIDPSALSLSDDARQNSDRQNTSIGYESGRFLSDLLTFNSSLHYRRESLNFSASDSEHTLHTVGADLTQEYYAAESYSFVYGGSFQFDTADSTEIGGKDRTSFAAYMQVPVFPSPVLELIPAARIDYATDFDPALTYRLSFIYSPSFDISLKFSGGSSYRAPTFNDLYWPNDGWSAGNPDLEAEKGTFGEFGLTRVTPRAEYNVYIFTRYIKDEIQWTETSPWFYEPTNIGKSLYPGCEIDGEFNVTAAITVTGAYTFQYSYLLQDSAGSYVPEDDLRVPYTPVHALNAAIEYSAGGTTAGVGAEYSGSYYTDNANSSEEDGFFVVNLHSSRQLNDMITATFGVDNLFNTVYTRKDGYIAPPLTIRVGVKLEM